MAYVHIRIRGRGRTGIGFSFQIDPVQAVNQRPICILIVKPRSIQNCIVIDDKGGNSHKRRRLYMKKSPAPKLSACLVASFPSSMSNV